MSALMLQLICPTGDLAVEITTYFWEAQRRRKPYIVLHASYFEAYFYDAHRSLTDIQLDNIRTCLAPALTLLNELNDAFDPPFVQSIANTILSLVNVLPNIKQNKNECIQLMDNIHHVLYAIMNLTLHKIYIFVEGQQDRNKIKQLFRNKETNNLLKSCRTGLDEAMGVFKITAKPTIFNDIGDMRNAATLMHEELLQLIATLHDAQSSMLPSKLKIFYGSESELEKIMKMLSEQPARIAILGGGGMGKTSLARAVLHHQETCAKFEHIFFVSAESATTAIELAALIGLHVGLDPGEDLIKPVTQYLSKKSLSLLVLDNLETVWEPIQSRHGVEEFLSLLTEVEHLRLIVSLILVSILLELMSNRSQCEELKGWLKELAQKPHKPHAAFWHCVKPHVEIRPEVTEKPSQWRGSGVDRQVLDAKSVRNLSGAGVMARQTASPARASTR
ncbi:hypothetical protein B0H14DRAFT_2605609 [Mycena olivaceomarginata]|nr:hypothetical protein B0H14DRAFT_2605609 [Mycena olivaceomarginata]